MSDPENRESSARVVEQVLKAGGYGQISVFFFEELFSTSLWLGQRVQYADVKIPELCATHWQTAGVGRRGKKWQTAPGNITFSMKTYTEKPVGELLGLSLVTGLGVARCLEPVVGVPIKLKWPNDVIVNDRKLSGLLTEVRAGLISTIITGIGVNVLQDHAVASLGIGSVSLEELADQTFERDELLGRIAVSVLSAHDQFLSDGWAVFAEEWASRDWLLNRPVAVYRDGNIDYAIARGVDANGAMIIEHGGSRSTVFSGEVSIRPADIHPDDAAS